MKPVRSGPHAILLSLVCAVLIALSSTFVVTIGVYFTLPPRAEPDTFILMLGVALTLGPSVMLAFATRRASAAAPSWDLSKTGRTALILISVAIAIMLAVASLYPLTRLLRRAF